MKNNNFINTKKIHINTKESYIKIMEIMTRVKLLRESTHNILSDCIERQIKYKYFSNVKLFQ